MNFKTIIMAFFLTLCIGVIFAQGDILFSDTFTGADGTRPANWKIVNAPDANFWFIKDGQFCTGNGDDILTGGGFSYAIVNVPTAQSFSDYAIQTSCWIYQANGSVMVIARWQDENNHYRGVLETLKGARSLKIEKVLKGNRTVLAEVRDGVDGVSIPKMENGTSPADARIFRFIVSGSKLTFVLGDSVSVEAMDASFSSGAAGVAQWFHYAFFDDVLVQKVQPSDEPMRPVSQIPTVIQPVTPSVASSVTPGTIFRIVIGEGLPEQTAKDLRDQLISWGYTPIELFQKDTGFDVYLGAFLSESEAQSAKGFLEEEGLSPRRVVSLSGERAVEVRRLASPATRKIFTVLAREFNDLASADKMKKALEGDGYFPVEIASVGSNQRVYIGSFSSSDEADKLARALKADGYDFAAVVESESTAPPAVAFPPATEIASSVPSRAFSPTDLIVSQPEWTRLTPDQQNEVEEFLIRQRALSSGDMVTQQIMELKMSMEKLSQEQQEFIFKLRQQDEIEKTKERTILDLIAKAEKARDQRQWDEALKYCEEVKKMDPNNGRIVWIERSIRVITDEDFEGKKIIDEQEREKIKRSRDMAENLEKQQKYEASRAQWAMVLSLANPGSLDYNDANTAIGRIDGILADVQAKRQKQEQSWKYTLYGIGGIMILLVFLIVMIVLKSRKHDRELLRQVQELTLKPLLELQEGKGPAAIEDMTSDVQPAAAMQTPTKKRAKVDKTRVAPPPPPQEPEPVFAEEPEEFLEPAPEPEILPTPEPEILPVPEMEPALSDSRSDASVEDEELPTPSFDEFSFDDALMNQNREIKPETPVSSLDEVRMDETPVPVYDAPESVRGPALDVDDLFAETADEESLKLETVSDTRNAPPENSFDVLPLESLNSLSAEVKKAPTAPPGKDDATEIIIPERKVAEPAPQEALYDISALETPSPFITPEPAIVKPESIKTEEILAATGKDNNIVYEQDFDQEDNGSSPANWKGSYNYASLVVSDSSPAPNSRKCIVFEKEKGAGSAFYSCRFADTSGVIGIEFDLRCDMKNKYLLGFYIEKDEDYRYSIHTVIQYINSGKQTSKPSLRVQGKPVPYNWGDWRRIKYIVNLIDATVDGYVDGELVANGEKLASCPTSLNTISIRDNLATVGKLMIDNIKIYKA